MERILVVDDEMDLRQILQFNLEAAGFTVDTASSAEEALDMLTPKHTLILLDVMMEGMSGWEMARIIRQDRQLQTPIIFLTAKVSEDDVLHGFDIGADDYITKPFSTRQVLARIQAILRRTASKAVEEKTKKRLVFGNLTIDFDRKVVCLDNEEIRLSPKEFGILATLAAHPGRLFSREEILDRVWQGEAYVLDRTVDVHIARVRRKLGESGLRITNRQGYGYCFE